MKPEIAATAGRQYDNSVVGDHEHQTRIQRTQVVIEVDKVAVRVEQAKVRIIQRAVIRSRPLQRGNQFRAGFGLQLEEVDIRFLGRRVQATGDIKERCAIQSSDVLRFGTGIVRFRIDNLGVSLRGETDETQD